MPEKTILCSCSNTEHQFKFMYFDHDLDYVYMEVHLVKQSFLHRVWEGLKYMFGHTSKYGCFDEVVLTPSDVESMKQYFSEYINAKNKVRTTGASAEDWCCDTANPAESPD